MLLVARGGDLDIAKLVSKLKVTRGEDSGKVNLRVESFRKKG